MASRMDASLITYIPELTRNQPATASSISIIKDDVDSGILPGSD